MGTSFRRTATVSLLMVAAMLRLSGCARDPSAGSEATETDQHPHTAAMLKMIQVMERSGYRPTLAGKSDKSFAEDPIAWLGPSHIAAPDDYPYQTEWRLTIYRRGEPRQFHSFLSVEGDTRFSQSLVAALIEEWRRMAPVGLPKSVVESGERLVREAAYRFARERSERPSSMHTLNDARAISGQYELRVEFYDREGFADSEGVELNFGRAILVFTLTERE